MQLSQKERMLLEDEKQQEEICIVKYQNYSGQAQDPQLKQLFSSLSTEEQHHYDMINQMLQGQQPNMSHSQQQSQQSGSIQQSQPYGTGQSQQSQQYGSTQGHPYSTSQLQQSQQYGTQQSQQQGSYQGAMGNTGDKILCVDMLSTEKYVSGTYNTSIFEAADPTLRQALQHIQKDEQNHGEQIFNYMSSHGMYKVQ